MVLVTAMFVEQTITSQGVAVMVREQTFEKLYRPEVARYGPGFWNNNSSSRRPRFGFRGNA